MSAQVLRKLGIEPAHDVWTMDVIGDPSTGDGCEAGIGSYAIQMDASRRVWKKIDTGDTAWQPLTPASNDGTVEGSSIVGTDMIGAARQVLLTITARALAVTDALAYAGTKIFTFPQGRIHLLGCTGRMQFGITSDPTTTINVSADMDWSLGSVTASSITLASTMVDIAPKADAPLAAAQTTLNTETASQLAAAAIFDGTTTPLPVFLNVGFPTNTQIDGDGILAVTGTVLLSYVNLGDK